MVMVTTIIAQLMTQKKRRLTPSVCPSLHRFVEGETTQQRKIQAANKLKHIYGAVQSLYYESKIQITEYYFRTFPGSELFGAHLIQITHKYLINL